MKRPSLGGFTAAGVLVVAVLGGVVGGAVAMSGQNSPAAPAAPVSVHQVADEATAGPTPAPATTDEAIPEPTNAPAASTAPVDSSPAPAAPAEDATTAANRAEKAADRADNAADRAETSASKLDNPAPTSTVTPTAPVAPVAPEPPKTCTYASRTYNQDQTWTDYKPEGVRQYMFTYRCDDGDVVETNRMYLRNANDPMTCTYGQQMTSWTDTEGYKRTRCETPAPSEPEPVATPQS